MMIKMEEEARQHFEELKRILPTESPGWWRLEFKIYVDEFIKKHINRQESILFDPFETEKEEIDRMMCLHGLRRLVAGAVQEWELVQQPKHAAICAKLDGALVWQGRRYVSLFLHAISSLQPSLQG
jgi:hypothetical protein